MDAHHKYSPSNYNAWNECVCWASAKRDTREADAGTSAHDELSKALSDSEYVPESYAARWAADKIRELAGDGAEVKSEVRLVGSVASMKGVYGTTDAMWSKDGVQYYADFKTFSDGLTDYIPQLKGYAALGAKPDDNFMAKVVLVVLHGGCCSEEVVETTLGECVRCTDSLLMKVRKGNGEPKLCKWCQYCGRIGECAESNNAVQVVNDNAVTFSRLSLCQKLVVLDTVDKLSKTIREQAKAVAVMNGGAIEMDGIRYEMKPWAGKPKVKDLCEVASSVSHPKYLKINERKQEAEEVELVGLSGDELLKLCDLGKTALYNALASKNPDAVKADIKRYVEQFYETAEGTPHFVRTK